MGRRPASAAVLRAVVAAVLVVAAARAVEASPVLDDEALARGFVDSLGRLVEAGEVLEADAAREQLAAATGTTAFVPKSAAAHRIVPRGPLYDAVLPAVVAVGSVYAVTGVAAADAGGDAAVVRIDGRGHEFPCLGIAPAPASGTPVSVISHPRGRFYCLTEGVVSRYHRQRRQDRDDAAAPGPPAVWMSVTADYAMGSSGGPVFDAAGRVVGMVSRTATLSPRPRPAGAGNADGPAQPSTPQMIFKDCVSAQTLQRLLGADDRGDSPPPDAGRSRAQPQRPVLEVGDPAPRLQVGEWVQGEPVTEFRGDESLIEEVLAGTFDLAGTQRARGRAAARMSGLTRDVYEAIAAQDWARADAGIEEYAGLLPPAQAHRAGQLRVAFLKGDSAKAVELQARVVALSKPAAKPRMQQFLEAYQSGRLPDAASRRGTSRADGPAAAAP